MTNVIYCQIIKLFLLTLTITFTLSSCSEDALVTDVVPSLDTAIEQRSSEPTLQNGKLNFNSPNDFVSYISNLETSEQARLDNTERFRGFNSLRTSNSEAIRTKLNGNDAFASVLNQNATVVVGGYLFKLNFEEEQVYAISATAPSRLIGLVESAESSSGLPSVVDVFSFEDEVFLQVPVLGCEDCIDLGDLQSAGCDGAPGDSDEKNDSCNLDPIPGGILTPVLAINVTVRYQQFGIYFKLSSKGQAVEQDFTGPAIFPKVSMNLTYNAWWIVKCKNPGFDSGTAFGVANKVKVTHYSGFKKLSRYNLTASLTGSGSRCAPPTALSAGPASIAY